MVDISSGMNVDVGWAGEASYGAAAATTIDLLDGTGAGSMFFEKFGLVTDVTLTPTVERYHGYGTGNQTRITDGILKEGYELSITALWQDDASRGCIHKFLEAHEDGTYESYLIRIDSEPAGDGTIEYAYLIGCVLRNVSIKISVGDVVGITLTFVVKQVDSDNWQTLAGRDYLDIIDDLHVGASLGMAGDVLADTTGAIAEIAGTGGADDGKYVLLIGENTVNAYVTEIVGPLNDPAWIDGAVLWKNGTRGLLGAVLLTAVGGAAGTETAISTAADTITIRIDGGGADLIVLTVGESSQGVLVCNPDGPGHGAVVASEAVYGIGNIAGVTERICIVGQDENDADEVSGIIINGVTPVSSSDAYNVIYYITYGQIPAVEAVRVYKTIHTDPTMYHECDVTLPAELIDIGNELQEFNLDESYNPAEIMNFEDSVLKLAGGSLSEETTFGGSAYGDDTSMGVNAVLSRLVLAAGTGAIVVKIGSYWEYNMSSCSYDNLSFPFKEKELIIMTFDGKANSMTLDDQ